MDHYLSKPKCHPKLTPFQAHPFEVPSLSKQRPSFPRLSAPELAFPAVLAVIFADNPNNPNILPVSMSKTDTDLCDTHYNANMTCAQAETVVK